MTPNPEPSPSPGDDEEPVVSKNKAQSMLAFKSFTVPLGRAEEVQSWLHVLAGELVRGSPHMPMKPDARR